MFLKKSTNKKTGRTQLSIVKGYRDSNGKVKQRTVRHLGYLDELEKKIVNPIEHYTLVAKEMTEEEKVNLALPSIQIPLNQSMENMEIRKRNLGYIAYSKIYTHLGISKHLVNHSPLDDKHPKAPYVLKYLTFAMLLNSFSNKKTENTLFPKGSAMAISLFENFYFLQKELIQTFQTIQKQRHIITSSINKTISNLYPRGKKVFHYSLPIWHTEDEPYLHYLTLYADAKGIPFYYDISKESYLDSLPSRNHIHHSYLGKEPGEKNIFVSKVDFITEKKIIEVLEDGESYIFQVHPLNSSPEFKAFILNHKHYPLRTSTGKLISKSRLYPRRLSLFDKTKNRKKSTIVHERQIVIYDPIKAKEDKETRIKAIAKAKDYISNPSYYANTLDSLSIRYLNNFKISPKTGAYAGLGQRLISLNNDKILEDAQFDGYTILLTNDQSLKLTSVISACENIKSLEDHFNNIEVYLTPTATSISSLAERVEISFLCAFISFLILTILQNKLDNKFDKDTIKNTLLLCNGTLIMENYYLFDYYSETLKEIGRVLDIDFSNRALTTAGVRDIIAGAKKK